MTMETHGKCTAQFLEVPLIFGPVNFFLLKKTFSKLSRNNARKTKNRFQKWVEGRRQTKSSHDSCRYSCSCRKQHRALLERRCQGYRACARHHVCDKRIHEYQIWREIKRRTPQHAKILTRPFPHSIFPQGSLPHQRALAEPRHCPLKLPRLLPLLNGCFGQGRCHRCETAEHQLCWCS